jgi:hypothetical protein
MASGIFKRVRKRVNNWHYAFCLNGLLKAQQGARLILRMRVPQGCTSPPPCKWRTLAG